MADYKALIDLGNGHLLKMTFELPDEEINLEGLLRIDLSNIPAEIVTLPIAMHKFGMLRADATNAYNKAKLNLSIYEASQRKKIREEADKKKMTIQEIDDELTINIGYKKMKEVMFTKQKEMEYIDSLCWALKSKDEKLNKLSLGMQTGDIYEELIETKLKSINFVNMKLVKPLIK